MKGLAKYCLSTFYLLFALAAASAQTDARAELDSNYAETGNPFTIHLYIPQDAGRPDQIDFSVWESIVPHQNILKQTEWLPSGQSFTKDLTLVFFDEDSLTLPPLPIRLSGGGAALTNPLEITIIPTPAPDDLVEMSDIKDIRREPPLWLDYLPWALAIAGFILLIVLASWLIGRAQKKHGTASRSVELPPHELALKKLDVLEQKQLWHKGLVKEYCAELTFIVREYLEKQFHILALESTSEEILEHLKGGDFPQYLRPPLQDFLTHADLVKFAKATPPETFHEEAIAFSRKLILETKPLPISPDQPIANPQSTNRR